MAISVDQSTIGGNKQTGAGLGTTFAFTTTATVAAGATIVVAGGWFSVLTTLTGVSGGGLSWTIDIQGRAPAASSFVWMASAYAPSGMASGTSITATYGLTIAYPTIGGLSFAGVKTSSPVDGTPLGITQVATAGWDTGNYVTSGGAVIVAIDWSEGTVVSNTPTSPSLESGEQNTLTDQAHVIEYRIETAAGSYPVAGAWNAGSTNGNAAVAYKAAAGGASSVLTADHGMGMGRW